jgi:DNA-directed RNA polymerase subunit H (RpoH/RPB5)
MAQSGHIVQIFKSRNNILDLLETQGFDTTDWQGSSISEVHSMQRAEQMDMLLTTKDNTKKVYVKYHTLAKSLRHNNIYEYIDDLFNLEEVLTKKDDLIIIVKDEPNEPLTKTLRNIWEQDGIFVTVFNINRLQFNVLEHSLVPPHRILDENETAEVRQKYNITERTQVPDISRFSPISQAIGMRPGQMCEIRRPSKTAISTNFYRICSS